MYSTMNDRVYKYNLSMVSTVDVKELRKNKTDI